MKHTLLVALALLVTGCVRNHVLHVVGPYPELPSVKRSLLYWTANFSTNTINHYWVAAVKPSGGFTDALVYWKEERTILDYAETVPDSPPIFAFHHQLKLDRDTVDTTDDIAGSTYLVTHRTWLEWMEGCLSRGHEYVITLDEAKRQFGGDKEIKRHK